MPARAAMTIHPNRLMQASVVSIQRACNPRGCAAVAGSQVSNAHLQALSLGKGSFRRGVDSVVVAVVVGPRVVGGRSVRIARRIVVAGRLVVAVAGRLVIAVARRLVVGLRVAVARVVGLLRAAGHRSDKRREGDDRTGSSHSGLLSLLRQPRYLPGS